MRNYEVQVLSPEEWIMRHYAIDGRVVLDLPGDFNLRMSKPLIELSDAGEIGQEISLGVSLPYSPVNDAVMGAMRSTSTYPPQEVRFDVVVKAGGQVLDISHCLVLGASDAAQAYNVELVVRGWSDFFESTALADLNLGTFLWTKANIAATWGYFDFSQPYPNAVAPPVDYGKWNTPGTVTPADLRLWLNAADVLRSAFCAAGYQLEAGFVDAYEDLVFCYLAGERWHWYEDKGDTYRTDTEIAAPRTVPVISQSQAIELDYVSGSMSLDPVTNEYIYAFAGDANLYLNVRVRNLKVRLPPQSPRGTFAIFIQQRNGGAPFIWSPWQTFRGSETAPVDLDISFDVVDEDCRPNRRYGVFMFYADTEEGTNNQYDFDLLSGEVAFMPDPFRYHIGDSIPLASLIDPAISCMDFLKGIAHLHNAKFAKEDRLALMHPPRKVRNINRNVEGFFLDNKAEIDLTEWTESDSMEVADERLETERLVDLQFQGADEYAKSIGLENPYSRRIDLGGGKVGVRQDRNPLFAPTLERLVPGADIGGAGAQLPVAWDNTEGRLSRDIKPRIAGYQGNVGQTGNSFNWDGDVTIPIPYLTQNSAPITGGIAPNFALVYGTRQFDLYELYWRSEFMYRQRRRTFSFLVEMNVLQYYLWGSRERYGVLAAGQYRFFRLLGINDFSPTEGDSTPMDFTEITC